MARHRYGAVLEITGKNKYTEGNIMSCFENALRTGIKLISVLQVFLLLSGFAANFKKSQPSGNDFVGVWSLISYEHINADDPDKPPIYTRGRDMIGYLLYTADGYMSATVLTSERPLFKSNDLYGGTTEEKAKSAETYTAYCARYTIEGNAVIHHVETSLFPNWVGIDLKRFYSFEDGRLVLSTAPMLLGGIHQIVRLVWERVEK